MSTWCLSNQTCSDVRHSRHKNSRFNCDFQVVHFYRYTSQLSLNETQKLLAPSMSIRRVHRICSYLLLSLKYIYPLICWLEQNYKDSTINSNQWKYQSFVYEIKEIFHERGELKAILNAWRQYRRFVCTKWDMWIDTNGSTVISRLHWLSFMPPLQQNQLKQQLNSIEIDDRRNRFQTQNIFALVRIHSGRSEECP